MSQTLMVRSVSHDEIRIGSAVYKRSIALTAETVFDDWTEKPVAELAEDDFAVLLDETPELIVLGTGAANIFPPRELVFAMARRGVGFEVMDTRAAARTFNVLAGEGRKVSAVLYL